MTVMIDVFGGLLLCAVLFRTDPLRDSSDVARKTRLFAGALVIGLLLGTLVYVKWPHVIWFTKDDATKIWAAFAGIPIIFLALVSYLNSLNGRFPASPANVEANARLVAGAFVCGLVLGALIYLRWPQVIWSTQSDAVKALVAFAVIPVIALIPVVLIVLIRDSKRKREANP